MTETGCHVVRVLVVEAGVSAQTEQRRDLGLQQKVHAGSDEAR